MRGFKHWLLAIGLLVASIGGAQAQSTNVSCMPITGIVSGIEFAQDINAALRVINRSNTDTTPPLSDCSGTTLQGQLFYNLGDTFAGGFPSWNIYDGSSEVRFGYVDPGNHIYLPIQGGGLSSIASSATVDACSVPQNFITVTGTTSITSFGTGSACSIGQWKYVKFQSPLTVTASTAILTQTGNNINVQAGEVDQIIYLGGGAWQFSQGGSGIPTGSIIATAAASADPGYLFCYGQAVSRAQYPALFAAIGTTYGAGDGSTTFNLPDLRGRFVAGVDNMGGTAAGRISSTGGVTGTTLGATGGAQVRTIAEANLPSYDLPILAESASSSSSASSFVNNSIGPVPYNVLTQGNNSGTFASGGSTGNQPFVSWPASPGCSSFSNCPTYSFNVDQIGVSTSVSTSTSISVTVGSGGSGTALQALPPTIMLNFQIKT